MTRTEWKRRVDNPYLPPESLLAAPQDPGPLLDDLASGQKFAIYAILLYFAMLALRAATVPAAGLLYLACMVLAAIGIYRMARGLEWRMWRRVLALIGSLLPLVGLLILLRLNFRASSSLKAAGYSVGLLGARNYRK